MATTTVRVPDRLVEQAKLVKKEYDHPTLGEALRHMAEHGTYEPLNNDAN
jgi:hypothetical protein